MTLNKAYYFYFPLVIFIVIWISVLLLFQISSLELYLIDNETIILFMSSILLVQIGFLSYRYFKMENSFGEFLHKYSYTLSFNYRKLIITIIILNFFVVIFTTIYILKLAEASGGFIKYISNPILSRQFIVESSSYQKWDVTLSLVSYLKEFIIVSLVFSAILFTSKNILFKSISVLSLVLGMIIGILNFSRYMVVFYIFMWICMVFYTSYFLPEEDRISTIKSLLILSIITTVIFVTISYAIIYLRFFTSSEKEIFKVFLEQLNYYIVGNVVGFDQYISQNPTLQEGASIFRNIFKWLHRIGVSDLKIIEGNYSFLEISTRLNTNTYSYLRVFYEDYGTIGVIAFSLLWGLSTAYVTHRFLLRFTLIRLYMISIFCFSLFMSFFGFYLIGLTKILYNIFLIGIFQKFLLNKFVSIQN